MKNKTLLIVFVLIAILSSCKKNTDNAAQKNTGNLVFYFEHYADGEKLIFDEMKYTNAAGNQYEVSEIQWFVSDLTLHKEDGSKLLLGKNKFAHYVDTNLPETWKWIIPDEIPEGEYTSVSMTFGIKGEKNKPRMFTDPPENDMLWPVNLGGDQGGYHYMKLNGFWINKEDQRTPFNFHLGVGQEKDAGNNITGFIQNWFETDLPASAFQIVANEPLAITIRMNVEKWWEQPNVYNHDDFGGKIMQNQKAMRMGVENGRSVFSIGGIAAAVAQ